jgi:hypothetical protein
MTKYIDNGFKVVKDGKGWGVVDTTGAFINDKPMNKKTAKKLANDCKCPATS